MPTVIWADDARQELIEILDFVSDKKVSAADRLLAQIQDAVQRVSISPKTARSGRVNGTREKSVSGTHYIIAFKEMGPGDGGPGIAVLHIVHSARDWPKGSWPKP